MKSSLFASSSTPLRFGISWPSRSIAARRRSNPGISSGPTPSCAASSAGINGMLLDRSWARIASRSGIWYSKRGAPSSDGVDVFARFDGRDDRGATTSDVSTAGGMTSTTGGMTSTTAGSGACTGGRVSICCMGVAALSSAAVARERVVRAGFSFDKLVFLIKLRHSSERTQSVVCFHCRAQMAELVDALGSGPSAGNGVEVRVLFWAPMIKGRVRVALFHWCSRQRTPPRFA